MPESQKMVHLTPVQRRRKKFKHPLIDNVPEALTEDYLDQLLSAYFETAKVRIYHAEIAQELVVNYFRLLRSVVARFLYHWPVSRRFLDEMVSTGVETIVTIIADLEPTQLEEDRYRSLGGLIEGKLRFAIETIINKFRGVAPAPRSTNHERERAGERPIYGTIEFGLSSDAVKDLRTYMDTTPLILEVKDLLGKIVKTDFEEQILLSENWDLSNAELAEKLGKGRRWVSEIRNRLHKRYEELEKRTR